MSGKPKHGLSLMPEYRAWQTMVHRCTKVASPAYERYGGRGITVCAGWLRDPAAFVRDMGPRPARHELDRRDNDKGYWCGRCPECRRLRRAPNCRWVTRKINGRNRSSNVHVSLHGRKATIAEWCEKLGKPRDTVRWRLLHGWSAREALLTPVRHKRPNGAGRA